MRCPYCGGLNQERAVFCGICGRDLRRAQQNVPPQRPAAPPQQSGYQPNQPTHRAPAAPQPQAQTSRPPAQSANRRQSSASQEPALASLLAPAPAAPEPEAPGPFPPRTVAQLEALLEPGRQAYTVTSSGVENGKKIVSISYPRCAAWQQAATLLQALKEQQEARYKTTIIRGFFPQQQNLYAFTNGQLQFDSDVRLGSQLGTRYIIETGNGYAADALRFVLTS